MSLESLEDRVRKELELLAYPAAAWVPERAGPDGPLLDVLVIGGGQGGLAVAFALKRQRVNRVRVVEQKPAGTEGPWLDTARMITLRSPKEVTGPDLGFPSLTFQAWFEAQQGEQAWRDLNKIAKEDWAAYLAWFRTITEIEVENEVRFEKLEPNADGHLVAHLLHLSDGRRELVHTRKIVLATGIEATGRWWAPEIFDRLERSYWCHTGDPIDFAALKDKRVAVIGAGASAFDNASTALEAGAAKVSILCRREALQRIQPFKLISFPGFLGHFEALDDLWRWRFMNYLLTIREAFPRETWERASQYAGFELVCDAEVSAAEVRSGEVVLTSSAGEVEADFVIVGTGFDVDLRLRPELSGVAVTAALWSERYIPPAGEDNARLGRYPYLGSTFEFQEKTGGNAPWLKHVRLFTYGSTVSFGPSGASINAMKFAVPKLVGGIVRDLFLEDVEAHYRALTDYQLPEFLFEGEDPLLLAPAKPVIDR